MQINAVTQYFHLLFQGFPATLQSEFIFNASQCHPWSNKLTCFIHLSALLHSHCVVWSTGHNMGCYYIHCLVQNVDEKPLSSDHSVEVNVFMDQATVCFLQSAHFLNIRETINLLSVIGVGHQRNLIFPDFSRIMRISWPRIQAARFLISVFIKNMSNR